MISPCQAFEKNLFKVAFCGHGLIGDRAILLRSEHLNVFNPRRLNGLFNDVRVFAHHDKYTIYVWTYYKSFWKPSCNKAVTTYLSSLHNSSGYTPKKNKLEQNAKLRLLKGAILLHLTYCRTVWKFCKASDSRKLERVQERALRTIYCDSNSTRPELLIRAKLPTLYNTGHCNFNV